MKKNERWNYVDRIMELINHRNQIRVSEVASCLYLNKDRVRRLLDWMVSEGYINKKTIKFAGNANMNVYTRK